MKNKKEIVKRDPGYLYFLLGKLIGLAKMTSKQDLQTELLALADEMEKTLQELKVLSF